MAEELLIKIGVQDKNATAQIRALQSNVKSLDTQLKLANQTGSKTSTSLAQLSDKYTLLSKKMQTYQTQLRSWKTRLSEANENIQRQQQLMKELADAGQEGTTQYAKAADTLSKYKQEANKAQNGIDELQARISNLNDELAETETIMNNFSLYNFGQNMTKVGDELQNTGVKIQNVGRGLSTIGDTILGLSSPFTAATIGAVQAAISYEDAFAGVRKTVDATEGQFSQLSDSIREMSKNMPESANEIAAVAEAAGQLGIGINDIQEFTEVMVMLGTATNMSSTEASTQLARLANITGMTSDEYSNLGSSIVHLGNNFATTESDITSMALRLAAAGSQVGMSEADILGLSTALSSVGIEAEAGGSAFSKAIVKMNVACEEGGDSLNDFAKVAGMSADEFKTKFETDATGAIIAFIQGLGNMDEQGLSAIGTLEDMGLSEVRLRDALLRSAQSSDLFTEAIVSSNEAWDENTALTNEAEERYKTTASKMEMLKNKITDVAISLGEQLLPHIQNFMEKAGDMVEWFGNLDESTQSWILKIGILGPLIGGVVSILGRFVKGIGSVTTGIGSIMSLIGSWATKQATATTAVSGTATALGNVASSSTGAISAMSGVGTAASGATALLSPLAIGVGAVAVGIAAIGTAWYLNEKKCEAGAKQLQEAGFVAEDLTGKVKGTTTVLDEMFGHEYNIKFSDEYKTATQDIENNIEDWKERLEAMQTEITDVLNSTEIDEDTKKAQVQAIVQPIIDETTKGAETIKQNQEAMYKSVEEYATKTFGKGSESYDEYIKGYETFANSYKTVYEQDKQEILDIAQKVATGELEYNEDVQNRILDLKKDMAEAEKNLSMANASDYMNQLELNGEKENAYYDERIKNINKYTNQKVAALNKATNAEAEANAKQADELYRAGSITREVYEQQLADIESVRLANLKLNGVVGNSVATRALYEKNYADQTGLTFKQVEGNIKGLVEVYDSNGNTISTILATSETALYQYAEANGETCETVKNEFGAMTQVVADENGNIIAQLASNEYAWKNNAGVVVNALSTEIDSVKSGSSTVDDAMVKIRAKLASGEISFQDFGFTSEEAFLLCAESALNARGDVIKVQAAVDALHSKEIDVVANVYGLNSLEYSKALLDSLRDKNVNVNYTTSGSTVVQHTTGGSWPINEQGTHGELGHEQLAHINENVRGSRAWELVDGPYQDLGTDTIGTRIRLGTGASVKSNVTSTAMMRDAVKEEVAKAINNVYFDYGIPSSAVSQRAFNYSQGDVYNTSNFDDSNIVGVLGQLLSAVLNQNMSPVINFSPKQMAKTLTPYIDRQLSWNKKNR